MNKEPAEYQESRLLEKLAGLLEVMQTVEKARAGCWKNRSRCGGQGCRKDKSIL